MSTTNFYSDRHPPLLKRRSVTTLLEIEIIRNAYEMLTKTKKIKTADYSSAAKELARISNPPDGYAFNNLPRLTIEQATKLIEENPKSAIVLAQDDRLAASVENFATLISLLKLSSEFYTLLAPSRVLSLVENAEKLKMILNKLPDKGKQVLFDFQAYQLIKSGESLYQIACKLPDAQTKMQLVSHPEMRQHLLSGTYLMCIICDCPRLAYMLSEPELVKPIPMDYLRNGLSLLKKKAERDIHAAAALRDIYHNGWANVEPDPSLARYYSEQVALLSAPYQGMQVTRAISF